LNAVIIGASSGIGAQLAIDLSAEGYSVGLMARRLDKLDSVAETLSTPSITRSIDLVSPDDAAIALESLVSEMDGVDLFVISSGVGLENPDLEWTPEAETIAVNVVGFARIVNVAAKHLAFRGKGHLVGISSIAAIRSDGGAPAYGASKAFESSYLQALRHRFAKSGIPIVVTDVKAGFVDTAMAKGEGLFWVAPVEKASHQIVKAIKKKKSNVYVTKRWRVVAAILRVVPEWLYHKL